VTTKGCWLFPSTITGFDLVHPIWNKRPFSNVHCRAMAYPRFFGS
jgi:hypothetical protein